MGDSHKPNLSFNVGIQPFSPSYTIGAVLVGFLLQAGVLIFAALATYYFPASLFQKNGRNMSPWAFPCTFTGTVMLCFGMFSCARIIERCSFEAYFMRGGIHTEIYLV